MYRTPTRIRPRFAKEVSNVFKAESLKDAKKRLAELEMTWSKQLPEAIECFKNGFAASTRYFKFPKRHWRRIRSTNGVERLNLEIKEAYTSSQRLPRQGQRLTAHHFRRHARHRALESPQLPRHDIADA